MKIINTNKIIIESFEKIGFNLQYVYQEPEDCDEISLSVELTINELKEISSTNIEVLRDYIISETDNDNNILLEFEELLTTIKEAEDDLFLVWE